MTQLGGKIPKELKDIRDSLSKFLKSTNYRESDASSYVTGRDFLEKIWREITAVPIGIAILTNEMRPATIANIFYELGVLDALGKESVVIKSEAFEVPSDFIRTEYISFNADFDKNIKKFFDNVFEREQHYSLMSELLQNDLVLSIDYLKRAYLISGNLKYKIEAQRLFDENPNKIDSQSEFMIKHFLK